VVGVIGADAVDPVHAGEDANVVAAEVAGSDNGCGQFVFVHGGQA
jgi:hypothetical protein